MEHAELVSGIRSASRELVRHWGFLGKSVAGSDLSGSAAHAVLEIGRNDGISARDLSVRLQLEKSTVSRLIKSLVQRGEVAEVASVRDGRAKHLHLTDQGRSTLHGIDRTAESQVVRALARLDPDAQLRVLTGLTDYAGALGSVDPMPVAGTDGVEIGRGYMDGLIGRVTQICAVRIQKDYPFGATFETKIALGMAEFAPRMDRPQNGIWWARIGDQVVGSITIDGENLGDGIAHLRWFALTEGTSGAGIGSRLLDAAITHCDDYGFQEIHLWTLKGLDAARSLYERRGFTLVKEYPGDQWGAEVVEQKFVRCHPQ